MMDIPRLTGHEFNPNSNNNSTASSAYQGHVHWHISEFNFSGIIVLNGVILGLEPEGCVMLGEK